MENLIRIYNVKWTSINAGVSSDNNKRTEIFLAGCNRAIEGNPCRNCFNPDLWDNNNYKAEMSPEDAFATIEKYAPNKYITFVGGEPLDQVKPLAELCKLLKEHNYHILVFTNNKLTDLLADKENKETYKTLLRNIDILIDGEYQEDKKIYDEDNYDDGFRNAIGSDNQIVWDFNKETKVTNKVSGFKAEDLEGLYLNSKDELIYITKDNSNKMLTVSLN